MKALIPIVVPPEEVITFDLLRQYIKGRNGDSIFMTPEQGETYKSLFLEPEENKSGFTLYSFRDLTVYTYQSL